MAKAKNGQNLVKADLGGLAEGARGAAGGGLPPVHLWNPPLSGELDMVIARDGTWLYQGSPIARPALVRLFSTILKREGDRYYLVTPVEKWAITVEDAPFVAVDFTVEDPGPDQRIVFVTNVGDTVAASAETPLRVARDPATGEPAPYVEVRAGLEALIDRKSFYRLVEIGETAAVAGRDWFGVRSAGVFFPIAPAEELEG